MARRSPDLRGPAEPPERDDLPSERRDLPSEGRAGQLWCPSGSAYAPESVVLAVRAGLDGPPAYLPAPRPAAEALAGLPPGVEPRRLLRLASHCVPHCLNREGATCTLATRLTAPAPPAPTLPPCHLRPACKWWTQSGPPACHACPQVATRHPAPAR